jgi:hypothetical protein
VILHVIEAGYLHDYVIWIRFNDGSAGEVDLEQELEGEVFGPLKDVEKFRRLHVDAELNTVVWENGADFAPEFLRGKIRVLT